ncbi:MAG TPA: hypothetical protein VNH16_21660 [Burkholderiales bacterium]|nr:hypothetical protein [Burkholderiales bacterium]
MAAPESERRGRVDRAERRGRRWRAFFTVAYLAAMIGFLATPDLRIVGLLLVPLAGFLLSWRFLNLALFDAPHWWRRFAYSGWHGRYRAFQGHRVRVIDGEKERPSRVYAADLFAILELAPSQLELQKLKARFRGSFQRAAEGSEANEWLFDDAACIAFVSAYLDDRRTPRGRTAHLLALWLERTVFMPIDNRRTAETGKTYAFTREAARR